MNIDYARVSALDQNLNLQIDALSNVRCECIFQEKITGTKLARPQLHEAINYTRANDVIVPQKLDRLGRSFEDRLTIVNDLHRRQVGLRSLYENIDTTTPTGKLIFHIFASLGRARKNIIKEWANAVLVAAKVRGRQDGRPKSLTKKQVHLLKTRHEDKDTPIAEIAKLLNISKKP